MFSHYYLCQLNGRAPGVLSESSESYINNDIKKNNIISSNSRITQVGCLIATFFGLSASVVGSA